MSNVTARPVLDRDALKKNGIIDNKLPISDWLVPYIGKAGEQCLRLTPVAKISLETQEQYKEALQRVYPIIYAEFFDMEKFNILRVNAGFPPIR